MSERITLKVGAPMRGTTPKGREVRGTFLRIDGLRLVTLLVGQRECTVTSDSLKNENTK